MEFIEFNNNQNGEYDEQDEKYSDEEFDEEEKDPEPKKLPRVTIENVESAFKEIRL